MLGTSEIIVLFLIAIFVASIFVATDNKSNKLDNKSSNKNVWYDTYYEKLLHQPEWKIRRNQILKYHNYTCDWCGTHNNLQIHHKIYLKLPNGKFVKPWEYDKQDLMCLCDSCHKKYHQKYKVNTYYCKFGSTYDL